MAAIKEPKMTADNIPDLNEIMENVINMVEYMQSNRLLTMKRQDKKKYDDDVFFKYREIVSPKIINILLEDINNLENLLEMFQSLALIKCGELDIEKETDNFAQKIESKYIYPKYGGKEKFFEMLEKEKKNKS
jgi:hypothetical protein